MKVISYIPARKTPFLVFTEERLAENSLYISHELYTERKSRYEDRLNAMLDYAFHAKECRNNLLLKYFGLKMSKPCGQCDICKSHLKDNIDKDRIEELTSELLGLLRKNAQYLGEILLSIEVKEDTLNEIVNNLLEEEKVFYLKDGRLALKSRKD